MARCRRDTDVTTGRGETDEAIGWESHPRGILQTDVGAHDGGVLNDSFPGRWSSVHPSSGLSPDQTGQTLSNLVTTHVSRPRVQSVGDISLSSLSQI